MIIGVSREHPKVAIRNAHCPNANSVEHGDAGALPKRSAYGAELPISRLATYFRCCPILAIDRGSGAFLPLGRGGPGMDI